MEITEDERATNNNGRFERQDRKLQILKDNQSYCTKTQCQRRLQNQTNKWVDENIKVVKKIGLKKIMSYES